MEDFSVEARESEEMVDLVEGASRKLTGEEDRKCKEEINQMKRERVSQGCRTELGGLKQDSYCLPVLETRSLHSWFHLRAPGENLFFAFLLVSGDGRRSLSFLGC